MSSSSAPPRKPRTVYGSARLTVDVRIRVRGHGRPTDFNAPDPSVVRRAPRTRRAPRPRPVRTPRQANAPPGKDDDDPHEQVALELAAAIAELGQLPARTLARHVRRRTETVLEVLRSDPRFIWTGKRRASLFDLATPRALAERKESAYVGLRFQ